MRLKKAINQLKKEGQKIGFVPTMGALHDGHISLVKSSNSDNDFTIVSIFVNPIQFNKKSDLENYPQNIDVDLQKLEKANCDIVFIPEIKEMYPDEEIEKYDLGGLDEVMEGEFRPGHFQGVAVIVKRFFDIIPAHNAYFGRKDFQQLSIIKHLVTSLKIEINIIGCETIRDKDGLAMSSRNSLLTKEIRNKVNIIPETLFQCKKFKGIKSISETIDFVKKEINKCESLKLEYFEIVSDNDLRPAKTWNESDKITACIAVWAGNVRLN